MHSVAKRLDKRRSCLGSYFLCSMDLGSVLWLSLSRKSCRPQMLVVKYLHVTKLTFEIFPFRLDFFICCYNKLEYFDLQDVARMKK